MATNFTYASESDLNKYFNKYSDYDNKSLITSGWTKELEDYGTHSNVNLYYAHNVGIVTQLFKDGALMTNLTSNLSSAKTQVATKIEDGATAISVDSTTNFGAYDLFRIDNEWFMVSAVTDGTTLGVSNTRGLFGTHIQDHLVDANVFLTVDEDEVDSLDQNWFFMMKI